MPEKQVSQTVRCAVAKKAISKVLSRAVKNAMQLPYVLVLYTGTYLGLLAICPLKVVRPICARVFVEWISWICRRARTLAR